MLPWSHKLYFVFPQVLYFFCSNPRTIPSYKRITSKLQRWLE